MKKWRAILAAVLVLVIALGVVGYRLSRDIIPWRRGTLEEFYGDVLGVGDITGGSLFRPELKVIPQENMEQLAAYLFNQELLACADPYSRQPAPSESLDWDIWISGKDDAALYVCIKNAYTLRIGAAGREFDSLPSWKQARYFVTEVPLDLELIRACLAISE